MTRSSWLDFGGDQDHVADTGSVLNEILRKEEPRTNAPCGLRGCKNRPAPFPGRMS